MNLDKYIIQEKPSPTDDSKERKAEIPLMPNKKKG
jgi:hypothetical protein